MTTTFSKGVSDKPLPDYCTVNLESEQKPPVLIKPSRKLTFPLTLEDLDDIRILEAKYDAEENCAGLAAPQIGIDKQIIVFAAPENPGLKKWRPDFTQTMDKTIWINPSYESVGEDKQEDYEACFSVLEVAGPVKRYKKIRYKAFTMDGEPVEGLAEGYLARLIQHETDHINGTLYIDYVPREKLLKVEEYRQKRRDAMAAAEREIEK
ncbi:MAG: peptide deformylase [Alphaproteobacteria bacterium]|jgi:peptide deformylase|nr:peptide deformylase [Alphaproteobacteria bacterium]